MCVRVCVCVFFVYLFRRDDEPDEDAKLLEREKLGEEEAGKVAWNVPKQPLVRILRLIKGDTGWMIVGVVGALIMGTSFPAFALVLG